MAEENTPQDDQEQKVSSSMSKAPMIGIATAAVVLVGAGAYVLTNKGTTNDSVLPTNQSTSLTAQSSSPKSSATSFKDGTYTADGNYEVHIGPEKILVKVTLKNNIITDSEVTIPDGTDPMSVKYQQMFIDNYKPLVIGKKITDVQLSKISGSSLTPIGFNNALEQIKAQAQI